MTIFKTKKRSDLRVTLRKPDNKSEKRTNTHLTEIRHCYGNKQLKQRLELVHPKIAFLHGNKLQK